MRLWMRFERFSWDIAGVFVLVVASMTLLAIIYPAQATGAWLQPWTDFLLGLFGWGSVWLVMALGALGLWMLRRRHLGQLPSGSWGRIVALELAAFTSLGLLAVMGGTLFARAEQGLDGGRVGWGLAELLRLLLAPLGLGGGMWRTLIFALILAWSLLVGLGLDRASGSLGAPAPAPAAGPEPETDLGDGVAVSAEPLSEPRDVPAIESQKKKKPFIPPEFRKRFQVQSQKDEKPAAPLPRDERLPGLDLLVNEKAFRPDERHINLTAGLIEKTLAEFGIPAKVVGFRVGPTVTQFAVEPGFVEKDKPAAKAMPTNRRCVWRKFRRCSRDLALALSTTRLRIEAPVPGRPYVGIEVPNRALHVVRLRPILESRSVRSARFAAGNRHWAGCIRPAGGGRPDPKCRTC